MFRFLAPILVFLGLARAAEPVCYPNGPCYSAAGIVNAANGLAGLAGHTFVSIYGTNLCNRDRVSRQSFTQIPLGGVVVTVSGVIAMTFYVSPTQINVLIPASTLSRTTIRVARDGVAGPEVVVPLEPYAPALFQADSLYAVAQRPDGSYITPEDPARPGEVVTLYATGLGETYIPSRDFEPPWPRPNWIAARSSFKVLLDGQPVQDSLIQYIGSSPCCAGLYQLNLRLPDLVGQNPEIAIAIDEHVSPPDLRLPVR